MKRFSLGIVVVAFAGLALMTGCADSGGGGGGLPKSEVLYSGSSAPAVIDSTSYSYYWDIPFHVYYDALFSNGMTSSLAFTDSDVGEEEVPGSISGSYLDWWNIEGYASTTRVWQRVKSGRTYSDYANSTDVLRGEGKSYYYAYEERTADGVTPLSLYPIGQLLTEKYTHHENFSAFLESTSSGALLRGGWMTLGGNAIYDTTAGTWTWSETGRANYGENDLANDGYWALLGAEADIAWDGSQTTYTASGTYCTDGGDSPFEGCVDFDFDLTFQCENIWNDCPPAGTQTVSTDTVSAQFIHNGEACFDYKVDIGKNGTWEFEGFFCD